MFLPRSGGKETLRDISQLRPGRSFARRPKRPRASSSAASRSSEGRTPPVEGELAPVGDRGAPAPTFDKPDRVSRRPDARLGQGRETEILLFGQVDETGRVTDRVPAVLGMRAVHCPAVEDDLEVQLPVASGENLEARRFGDDDEGPRMLESCFACTGGAHLFVDQGVKGKVAVQEDAGAPDGHERGGHGRESGFHVTGAAAVEVPPGHGRPEGIERPAVAGGHGVEVPAQHERRPGSTHGRVEVRPARGHVSQVTREFEERREEPGTRSFCARWVLARLGDQLPEQLERLFIVDRLEHASLVSAEATARRRRVVRARAEKGDHTSPKLFRRAAERRRRDA